MNPIGPWALVLLLLGASADAGQPIYRFYPVGCDDGPVRAPRGPFAVWVFCESALAIHIGVIYADHMTSPADGAWSITDRFWQAAEWAGDVQSFARSQNGETLFVSTGAIYGTSTLYRLDLRAREANPLSGPHTNMSVEIVSLDGRMITVRLRDIETDEATEVVVAVRRQGSR